MSRLGLLDGDYLLYVATNPDKELDEKGLPVKINEKFVYKDIELRGAIDKLEKMIIDVLRTIEAEWYLGFLTGNSFRYNIYPDYKANRKGREKPKYFKVLKEYLIDEWKFYQHKELEADDLVNIAKKQFLKKDKLEEELKLDFLDSYNPIIVSNDKDILNLEGLHFNPQKRVFIETTKDQAIEYFWRSMIVGDTADNIHGIKGLGEKAVDKLFNGLSSIDLPIVVFSKYISVMGDNEGIKAFYQNYRSLLILDEYEGLELPEPVLFKRKIEI